jgi:hypothetical protein
MTLPGSSWHWGGRKIGDGAHPHLLAGSLGCLHQGNAGLFGWIEPGDRIDHKQLGCHRSARQQNVELA